MGRRILEMALLSCFCGCSPAWAAGQSTDPPPAEAPATVVAPAAPTPGNVIPAGTLITVELTEPLSSGKSKSGDLFGLRLSEPIMIDGVILVAAGAIGQGEVIDAKGANIGGRPGRLVLAAHYLDSGPLHLKLQSFKLGGGGKDHSEIAVGVTIAVGIVGVLVPGGGIEYPAGTRATAKVVADVTIAALAPAPAPASPDPTPTPQ